MSQDTQITVDRAVFEDLVDSALLLECLEAAGIDNTDAYSEGYREFLAAKKERDDETA